MRFSLKGEGDNTLDISKMDEGGERRLHRFELEGNEWVPGATFYPDNSNDTVLTVLQDECSSTEGSGESSDSLASSSGNVHTLVAGLKQEVPGSIAYIHYPVSAALKWQLPCVPLLGPDGCQVTELEDAMSRTVWSAGTAQDLEELTPGSLELTEVYCVDVAFF